MTSGHRPDWLTGALWVAGSAVFLFIYLPLLVVVLYSLHDSSIIAWPLKLYTFDWYVVLFHDRGMIDAVVASVKLAVLAVVIALAVGVPSAFLLDRYDFPGKTLYRRFVLLPLILPGVVAGSIFTFSLTLGDFITPTLVGGAGSDLIGNVVYQNVGIANNVPFAAAFATVPLVVMGIYLLVARRMGAFEAL